MRLFVENAGLVDMRQRPIGVTLVDQIIEGAGRIIGMPCGAAESSVKHADIEEAIEWRRVGGHEVVGDVALPEALAMERDAAILEPECFRPSCRETIPTGA